MGVDFRLFFNGVEFRLFCQDSASEQVVLRDINRTFPAHDYFKEAGGVGQDSLYKICKVQQDFGLGTFVDKKYSSLLCRLIRCTTKKLGTAKGCPFWLRPFYCM